MGAAWAYQIKSGQARLISEARLSLIEWGEAFYDEFPAAILLRLSHVDGQPDTRQLLRIR